MRTRPSLTEITRRRAEPRCRDTCSTATDTWTTSSHSSSRTSCTPWWRRRWTRCSSTTCPGSRFSSSGRAWTSSASAGGLSCTLMSLLTTWRRTTNQTYSRYDCVLVNILLIFQFRTTKETWRPPRSSWVSILRETSALTTWWTSNRRFRTSTGDELTLMIIETNSSVSRYCDSRRKVLLAHVHEGYDNDWWEYTEANC